MATFLAVKRDTRIGITPTPYSGMTTFCVTASVLNHQNINTFVRFIIFYKQNNDQNIILIFWAVNDFVHLHF